MRYILRLNAVAEEGVSIPEKHESTISGLNAVDGPWGLPTGYYPPPDPGRELAGDFPLGKHLRGRGVRGFVSYRYRGSLQDHSACDDYIRLEFNPSRVDFESLVPTALAQYIAAFRPYSASVFDEEFIFEDFDRTRHVNRRAKIVRISPIEYLSESYCERALGLSVDEAGQRFRTVAHTITADDGFLIVGHTTPIPFESALALSSELSNLAGLSLPPARQAMGRT